jgi:uncharacterized Fe-S cluster-containing radical SAM superfamily protein
MSTRQGEPMLDMIVMSSMSIEVEASGIILGTDKSQVIYQVDIKKMTVRSSILGDRVEFGNII